MVEFLRNSCHTIFVFKIVFLFLFGCCCFCFYHNKIFHFYVPLFYCSAPLSFILFLPYSNLTMSWLRWLHKRVVLLLLSGFVAIKLSFAECNLHLCFNFLHSLFHFLFLIFLLFHLPIIFCLFFVCFVFVFQQGKMYTIFAFAFYCLDVIAVAVVVVVEEMPSGTGKYSVGHCCFVAYFKALFYLLRSSFSCTLWFFFFAFKGY